MISVNLVANTDLRTPDEFKQLVVKRKRESSCDWAKSPTWCWARRIMTRMSGSTAKGDLHGRMGAAHCQLAGCNSQRARSGAGHSEATARRDEGGIPYDSTEYIHDAMHEVLHTLTETLIIVVVVIFLFLGSVRSVLIPVVAIPISLIGAVFLMLLSGLRSICLLCWRSCFRSVWWSMTRSSWWRTSSGTCTGEVGV